MLILILQLQYMGFLKIWPLWAPSKSSPPFFLDMRDILKSGLHAEVNIRKTCQCLIILQIHDMPHPPFCLGYCTSTAPTASLQALALIPLQTARASSWIFQLATQNLSKTFWMRCALDHKQNFRNCYSSRLLKRICSYSSGAPVPSSCIWLERWPLQLWKTLHND